MTEEHCAAEMAFIVMWHICDSVIIFYYSTLYFISTLTLFPDAMITSMFVIIYITTYSTQSLIIALFSCLHRTLGIVFTLST